MPGSFTRCIFLPWDTSFLIQIKRTKMEWRQFGPKRNWGCNKPQACLFRLFLFSICCQSNWKFNTGLVGHVEYTATISKSCFLCSSVAALCVQPRQVWCIVWIPFLEPLSGFVNLSQVPRPLCWTRIPTLFWIGFTEHSPQKPFTEESVRIGCFAPHSFQFKLLGSICTVHKRCLVFNRTARTLVFFRKFWGLSSKFDKFVSLLLFLMLNTRLVLLAKCHKSVFVCSEESWRFVRYTKSTLALFPPKGFYIISTSLHCQIGDTAHGVLDVLHLCPHRRKFSARLIPLLSHILLMFQCCEGNQMSQAWKRETIFCVFFAS